MQTANSKTSNIYTKNTLTQFQHPTSNTCTRLIILGSCWLLVVGCCYCCLLLTICWTNSISFLGFSILSTWTTKVTQLQSFVLFFFHLLLLIYCRWYTMCISIIRIWIARVIWKTSLNMIVLPLSSRKKSKPSSNERTQYSSSCNGKKVKFHTQAIRSCEQTLMLFYQFGIKSEIKISKKKKKTKSHLFIRFNEIYLEKVFFFLWQKPDRHLDALINCHLDKYTNKKIAKRIQTALTMTFASLKSFWNERFHKTGSLWRNGYLDSGRQTLKII